MEGKTLPLQMSMETQILERRFLRKVCFWIPCSRSISEHQRSHNHCIFQSSKLQIGPSPGYLHITSMSHTGRLARNNWQDPSYQACGNSTNQNIGSDRSSLGKKTKRGTAVLPLQSMASGKLACATNTRKRSKMPSLARSVTISSLLPIPDFDQPTKFGLLKVT